MKTLVVYSSRSGVTKTLADYIARECGADVESVMDFTDRRGLIGYVKSLLQAVSHRGSLIGRGVHQPREYELIVLGTPIWGWNMSSPIRSYIERNKDQFHRVALFCTYGGSGQAKVFADMQALCGLVPIATLSVTTKTVQEGLTQQTLAAFVRQIKEAELSTGPHMGSPQKYASVT